MAIRVVVAGLTVDPSSKIPIVVLKEQEGDRAFPIWIGLMEASAIATELEGIEVSRPLTHDLLRTMIESLGGRVERVEVTALRGNTFFAVVRVRSNDDTFEVDARPSDAIALALRVNAPIFAYPEVIEQAHRVRIQQSATSASEEGASADIPAPDECTHTGPRPLDPDTPTDEWTEILENLDSDAFGKYKM